MYRYFADAVVERLFACRRTSVRNPPATFVVKKGCQTLCDMPRVFGDAPLVEMDVRVTVGAFTLIIFASQRFSVHSIRSQNNSGSGLDQKPLACEDAHWSNWRLVTQINCTSCDRLWCLENFLIDILFMVASGEKHVSINSENLLYENMDFETN